MTTLQAWLLLGIPGLALGLGLFVMRNTWGALLGYLVLLAAFGGLAVFDRPSAAVFGGLLALLYAAGRGGRAEHPERGVTEQVVPDAALHPKRRTGAV